MKGASSITFFKEEEEQVRLWDDAHEARGWVHKSDSEEGHV